MFKASRGVFGLLCLCLVLWPSRGDSQATPDDAISRYLPFERAPIEELRASEKKVFAHYMTAFPLRINPNDWTEDYYTVHYLSPNGEAGKFADVGGYIRERPLPRPQTDARNWKELDLREEVRRAVDVGIDGFSWNMLSLDRKQVHWLQGVALLEAAFAVDPGFKIMLMPDMYSLVGSDEDVSRDLAQAVEELSTHPSVYRLADGRLVVSPYLTEKRSPAFWESWLEEMASRGIDVALVGLFQGWKGTVDAYRPVLHGVSDWGGRDVSRARVWYGESETAHDVHGLLWMMPVAPQDFRPRSTVYWEAGNSEHFRVMWDAAIQSDADWVQLITWNDYSEHTEISPSTGIQWSFYDLTAFYTQWFKTGHRPEIVTDVLYYFHRIQAADAPRESGRQPVAFTLRSGEAARDQIELLAFLTEPGLLEVSVGAETGKRTVAAGLHSFTVPLRPGRPRFRLKRGGKTVIDLKSRFNIQDGIVYQDLLYRGGSSTRVRGDPDDSIEYGPICSIDSPRDGATLRAGEEIPILVHVNELGGSLKKIEFYAGARRIGKARSAPYSMTWKHVPPGRHSLTARAVDDEGRVTTSQAIGISVERKKH